MQNREASNQSKPSRQIYKSRLLAISKSHSLEQFFGFLFVRNLGGGIAVLQRDSAQLFFVNKLFFVNLSVQHSSIHTYYW